MDWSGNVQLYFKFKAYSGINTIWGLIVQLKELTQVFESTGYGSQKATRFTRSNRNESSTPTLEKSMTQETLVEGGDGDVEQFDPTSLIDPVNVLEKLPKDLYDNMVGFLELMIRQIRNGK